VCQDSYINTIDARVGEPPPSRKPPATEPGVRPAPEAAGCFVGRPASRRDPRSIGRRAVKLSAARPTARAALTARPTVLPTQFMSTIPTISNLEAAHRQLCTAIRLFFADDDAVAVHTLACAAREIYEKHCRATGRGRMFDFVQAGNPAYAERDLWNLLNAARNFFKHPAASPHDRIEFDDSMNDFQLLAACTDCATLSAPHQPPEVQAFSLWFVAVEEPDAQAMAEATVSDADTVRLMQKEIDRLYPGMRTAPRGEKKRFGARLVQEAQAGQLVERCDGPAEGDVAIGPGLYVVSASSK
jgi:hypothetical protein